jgi:hypothetical protein
MSTRPLIVRAIEAGAGTSVAARGSRLAAFAASTECAAANVETGRAERTAMRRRPANKGFAHDARAAQLAGTSELLRSSQISLR